MRGYVYLGGQLVGIQSNSAVSTVHQDPITKSQRITDSSGNLTSTIVDLDPWGGETGRSSNAAFQPHRFTSYDRDANGGDDAMMRRYQSSSSRFNQPDPYGGSYNFTDPQSLNRYTYTQNDPVNFVDPSGLTAEAPVAWSPCDGGRGVWVPDRDERNFNCVTVTSVTVEASPWSRIIEAGEGLVDVGTYLLVRAWQNPPQRNPREVKRDFYRNYQEALNRCINQIFGNDARRIPRQTQRNAPILNTRLNRAQVGANSGVPSAIGSSRPFRGRHGTVLIATEVFNGNTPNTLNAIYGTYVHELSNVLDIRLNPNVPSAQYGRTYGNPNDPADTDTGAALEKCVFGSLQFP